MKSVPNDENTLTLLQNIKIYIKPEFSFNFDFALYLSIMYTSMEFIPFPFDPSVDKAIFIFIFIYSFWWIDVRYLEKLTSFSRSPLSYSLVFPFCPFLAPQLNIA